MVLLILTKPLQRILIINKSNNDIAIFGVLCLPDQDEIPVIDTCIDYGRTVCSYDIEAPSTKQGDRQLHILLDMLFLQERTAIEDRTEDHHTC